MFERFRLKNLRPKYQFHSTELACNQNQQQCVTVIFLDDTAQTFQLEKRCKGSDLMQVVFDYLELSEKDYFGLVFPQKGDEVLRWVDSEKQFKKQYKSFAECSESIPLVEFRVKFFVSDPCRLQEEFTRYQFYLQVKRYILLGKWQCSINTQCLLASYTVQSELGDFNALQHNAGYLSNMQLVSDQSLATERKICELHKLHRGQLPADAELHYLEHAKRLEAYGTDIHKAADSTGKELQLGVSSTGILVIQNSLRINSFSWSKMVKVSFKKKDFFIQLRRESSENYNTVLGFSTISHKHAKALWKSCVEHHSFFRLKRPHRMPRFVKTSFGSSFYYTGRTEFQAFQNYADRAKVQKYFVRSPSKRFGTSGSLALNGNGTPNDENTSQSEKNTNNLINSTFGTINKTNRLYDNKITSTQSESLPRKAWEQQSDDDADFLRQCPHTFQSPIQPVYGSAKHSPLCSCISNKRESILLCVSSAINSKLEKDLVTILVQSDEQGRFGFNVKGGVDLGLPVQVSKVVPNTPADFCTPKICEGDEVVKINGLDVLGLKHEQVVSMIRDCRLKNNGELHLTVIPNISLSMAEEEPLYKYVPENEEIGALSVIDRDDLFTQSLLLLSDGLASGALLAQYELMYRKNSNLAITEARKPENIAKNRYRDISPYDCTRVSLVNSSSGDYINANYVNMEIPGGSVYRYIATQGPLYNTTLDFWRMVQQESSHLVVMLTTVVEAGRQKCFQYFPGTGEELKLSEGFSVKCLKESPDETGSFVLRELILSDKRTGEHRQVQHMQYLAWPDHCVPSNPKLFLQFTERVRSARNKTLLQEIEENLKQVRLPNADADENGLLNERKCAASNGATPEEETPVSTSVHQCISAANPPVVVHCSAGIGRTGVLILMDTALAMMEALEPVYPLDIVRSMRDQRPCMVQNVNQYRFVCECICTAYLNMSLDSKH